MSRNVSAAIICNAATVMTAAVAGASAVATSMTVLYNIIDGTDVIARNVATASVATFTVMVSFPPSLPSQHPLSHFPYFHPFHPGSPFPFSLRISLLPPLPSYDIRFLCPSPYVFILPFGLTPPPPPPLSLAVCTLPFPVLAAPAAVMPP